MPKIIIDEYDLTSPGNNPDSTDVVYVPGFVDVTTNFNSDTIDDALEQNKPTLFKTVTSFEALCGKQPAVFNETQYYNTLVTPNNEGFSDEAVPSSGVMFMAGTADPGYVFAKELLNMGLNVLYERVNGAPQKQLVTEQPADFASTFKKYFYTQTAYKSINYNNRCPELIHAVNMVAGTEINDATTYYTLKEVSNDTGINVYNGVTGADIPGAHYTLVGSKKVFKIADDSIPEYFEDTNKYMYPDALVLNVTNDGSLKFDPEWVDNKYYVADDDLMFKPFTKPDTAGKYPVYTLGVQTLTKAVDNTYSAIDFVNHWTKCVESFDKEFNYVDSTWKSDSKNYTLISGIDIKTMYDALSVTLSSPDVDSGDVAVGLADRGNYTIKYLTTGGYPIYEYNKGALTQQILKLAENRGDCVAIIDHTDNPERDQDINHSDNLYYTVQHDSSWKSNGEFGTMFTPWATYNRLTTDKDALNQDLKVNNDTHVRMPASFAYLLALADSIKTNANWLAIAGSARGGVLHLATDGMTTNIPNGVADAMQPRNNISINPITNINPYGNTIWGNRTLKDNAEKGNLTATSFLNIRNLVSDVKKQCYVTARSLTFEQNNDILWVNFKAMMSPLLDKMLSGYGISGYKMVIDEDKMRSLDYPKATLCVKIILFPVYPVEDFYISIVLKDDDVSVAEA